MTPCWSSSAKHHHPALDSIDVCDDNNLCGAIGVGACVWCVSLYPLRLCFSCYALVYTRIVSKAVKGHKACEEREHSTGCFFRIPCRPGTVMMQARSREFEGKSRVWVGRMVLLVMCVNRMDVRSKDLFAGEHDPFSLVFVHLVLDHVATHPQPGGLREGSRIRSHPKSACSDAPNHASSLCFWFCPPKKLHSRK